MCSAGHSEGHGGGRGLEAFLAVHVLNLPVIHVVNLFCIGGFNAAATHRVAPRQGLVRKVHMCCRVMLVVLVHPVIVAVLHTHDVGMPAEDIPRLARDSEVLMCVGRAQEVGAKVIDGIWDGVREGAADSRGWGVRGSKERICGRTVGDAG